MAAVEALILGGCFAAVLWTITVMAYLEGRNK